MKTSESYQLYHFTSCVYCLKARFQLNRMGIELPLRNIRENPQYRHELIEGGGKRQVPCLRIEDENNEVRWLYESRDIVDYFKQQNSVEKH